MLTIIAMMAALTVAATPQSTLDRAAFESLKRLEGEWRQVDRPRPLKITYRTIASESVVVETWFKANGEQTMTVFLMNGDTLIATRYSAFRSQPTMGLTSVNDGELGFTFRSGTNMPADGSLYTHAMTLRRDGNRLVRTETFRGQDTDDTSRFEFARIR